MAHLSAPSSTRPKLLVLTPRFPYPVIGGDRLRIYQVCKELAKDCELTLLSLCESKEELTMALPDDGIFARVERIMLPRWRSRVNALLAIPTRTPLQVAYYRSPAFARALARLRPQHQLCLAHLIRTGDYLNDTHRPAVLEMTDAIALNYQRVAQLGNVRGLRAWVYRLESRRLLNYERKTLDHFDRVVLVSAIDRSFLTDGVDRPHVLVCSNGVDTEALGFVSREASDSSVVAFIGNITSLQNFDACLHFARDVLPRLRASLGCRFRVVGRICERERSQLEKFDGVEVTGPVDDIARAVADARLGVAPVRLGAGVQNKILEYMALGLPVVSSTLALEGFAALPERDLIVADTPEDMAAVIERLWNDSARRQSLAANGRAYVEQHHAWSAQLAPLRSAVLALTDRC